MNIYYSQEVPIGVSSKHFYNVPSLDMGQEWMRSQLPTQVPNKPSVFQAQNMLQLILTI